jgi:ribosomal protein L12E/L44/L45/RPP1/RPP2
MHNVCARLIASHPQMRHIAAYLLLQIGGNASPSAGDVKSLLATVGIDAEEERLEKLISELEGKDVNSVRPSHPCVSAPMLMCSYTAYRRGQLQARVRPVGRWRRRRRCRPRCGRCCCRWRSGRRGEEGGEEGGGEGVLARLPCEGITDLCTQEESDDDMGFGLFD